MGATTRDIFGAAPDAAPATPGSYGDPPRGGFRLPDATQLGEVHLQVADLARSLAFYERVLGLRVLARDAGRATLAAQRDPAGRAPDRALVELHERAGARPVPRRSRLGLYHVAIVLPDRPALGRFARHLAELGVYAGAGDHHVSEAFYLTDPDGLGIEVYADRPRDTWRRRGRELMMATDPVDVPGLVRSAGDVAWTGMPAGTRIGHVHLHVGNIEAAAAFFSEALGFDRTAWTYPGALFLAAGGYHHHVGANTWAGPGAAPPAADDVRLLEWTIELPDRASVAAAGRSLAGAAHAAEETPAGDLVTRDPWGTQIRIRPASPLSSSPA